MRFILGALQAARMDIRERQKPWGSSTSVWERDIRVTGLGTEVSGIEHIPTVAPRTEGFWDRAFETEPWAG